MELEGKIMGINKISEYSITINPKADIDNDKTVYADFEKGLVELLEKFLFKEEFQIGL